MFYHYFIKDNTISIKNCPVFKTEELVYLFYGIPAYKANLDENSKHNSFYPTCFILDIELLHKIKRVAPFDTGAFSSGIFDKYKHPSMEIENFLLTPSKETPKKIISFFYGENENYFDGLPKLDTKIDPLDFESESYLQMISDKTSGKADDRKSCIELQTDESIVLNQNLLKAIIIPISFLENEDVVSFIKKNNVDIITYNDYGQCSKYYYIHIREKVREYLKKENILSYE